MNISEHSRNLRNYLEFRNYAETSIKNYCSSFSGFLAYFESKGVTHPDRINYKMIIEFLGQFKEPATHTSYHSAIKIYYEKVAHIGIDKFKFIERPKRNKKLPIVLSQEEIQKMFNVCENLKHKTILALLYSCGLRVSELINLKWKHIDRSRKIINIIQAKGNKDRQVMLADSVVPLLISYCRKFKLEKSEYVLTGQSEPRYTSSSVRKVIKDLAEEVGINKRVHTHLIRHCSFTHMVENGVDINLIQRLAGHNSPKTTAIYTHISHNIISRIQSPIQNMSL